MIIILILENLSSIIFKIKIYNLNKKDIINDLNFTLFFMITLVIRFLILNITISIFFNSLRSYTR
jgi:hypothetical protein